jgi:hypothetical protein
MNDLEKNTFTTHEIQLLQVGQYCSVTKDSIINKFGSAPDWLDKISGSYWNDIKPLIDWILSNTPYTIVGVAKDDSYTNLFFVN